MRSLPGQPEECQDGEGVSDQEKEKAKTDRTKKIYIPYMCDHSFAVAAAFKACGVEAEVIPESDEETLYWGRKLTSGKECYPCIVTTGDMVKLVKDPNFDHERAAFFMPSGNGPCRFGQYHRFHRLVLDDLGFQHVPIYSPNQDETLYSDLGIMGSRFHPPGMAGDCGRRPLDEKTAGDPAL